MQNGFGVTQIEGLGTQGKVNVVCILIDRKRLADVVALIDKYTPQAFYAVSEIQKSRAGVFPALRSRRGTSFDFLRMFRLAK
jgi:uncharacterized protein YebE (UPF0316 family)